MPANTVIQVRRGTTAQWSTANPVTPAAGELCLDTTLMKMKIGDGATTFASLSFIEDATAHIADASDAHDASAISVVSTTLVGVGTDVQAVLEELDDAVALVANAYVPGGTDVAVADGGTGASTLTDHGVLIGSGTGAVTPLAVAATGTILQGVTGADPAFSNVIDGGTP